MRYNSETNYIQVKDGDTWYDYKYFDPTTPVPLIPAMTSATTPSGEVNASSVYSSNAPAWKAFDGNTEVGFDFGANVSPCWVSYDFKEPKDVRKARITMSVWGTYTWIIQGSNDGLNWVDVSDEFVLSRQTSERVTVEVDLTDPTNYSIYRPYCNQICHTPSSRWCSPSEIQLYGIE